MSWKRAWLLRAGRFGRRRWRTTFLLALLSLAAGAYFGSRLRVEPDVLALVPAGNRPVDDFRRALSDFGAIDRLLILADVEDEADLPLLLDLADRMADGLSARTEFVARVDHRIDLDGGRRDLISTSALLLLPPERLDEVARRLEDEAIERRVGEIARSVRQAVPAAMGATQWLTVDPLGLMPLVADRWTGAAGSLSVDLSEGAFVAPDRRGLVLLVRPTRPSTDLEFDRRLLEQASEAEAEARRSLDEDWGAGSAARIRLRYGGNYAIAVGERASIRADVRFNLIFSLLAVLTLYAVGYGRMAALAYTAVPLIVGQALTFVLAAVALGELNAATASFTALLTGLGTDFVIVMYARYVEERRRGVDVARATETMIGETGIGVFTGAITSAGTFFAASLSAFRGLRDLGFLIGTGILICAVVIVVLLPAMIVWNEKVRPRREVPMRRLRLRSFGIERLIPWAARNRRLAIAVVLVPSILGGWAAIDLPFDDTVEVLRSRDSPAIRVQDEIRERYGAALTYMMVVTHGREEAEALEQASRVADALAPLVERGTVRSLDGIASLLPPPSRQAETIAAVAARDDDALSPERVRATFEASLARHGLAPDAFRPFLDHLDRLLAPTRPLGLDDIRAAGLSHVAERYAVRTESGEHRLVTYLELSDPRWKREPPPGLVEAVHAVAPDATVTGTNMVGREFRRLFRVDAPRVLLAGLAVVFIFLWIDLASLRRTALALSQLLCGVAMMLGAMRLLDIHLNFVNAFVATMILGVGIDYSIHLIHRLQAAGGRIDSGLTETGKAVVLAALTNMAAFGTAALGRYPAMRSFGLVALIGSLTCLITALIWVPAWMARPTDERPGEPAEQGEGDS